jgi:hypothetical protein
MMPLEKEMLGAIKAPTAPLQRIIGLLEDLRAPDQIVAAAVVGLKSEQDPESRHPPFGKRLVNLGFTDIPPIGIVGTSAIDQLLSAEAARELLTRFDDEWRKKVQEWVHVDR